MDVSVHTGATKAGGGMVLVPLAFTSASKEQAILLLQVAASSREAKTLEEECVTVVQSSLLSTEGEPWHRLDGTLKELNGLFKGFMASRAIEDVHAIVALIDADGGLHVSHAGRAEAYLLRGTTATQITEVTRGKPLPAFVHISSGPLEAGDIVIFSTQRLLRAFTPTQLAALASREHQLLPEVITALEGERELAAIATAHVVSAGHNVAERSSTALRAAAVSRRGGRRGKGKGMDFSAAGKTLMKGMTMLRGGISTIRERAKTNGKTSRGTNSMLSGAGRVMAAAQDGWSTFVADLKHPQRKRRAHLLLVAGALAVFLLLWTVVKLSTNTQRSKTRTQLSELMTQIDGEIRTADNRRMTGDAEGANAVLDRAEDQAKQVINNDSGLFRSEALTLLDRIHAKKEELNNVVRVSPRVVVSLTAKNPDVSAQGMIGIADGEFLVYDRQNLYHVLLNSTEEARRVVEEDLIIDGAPFGRTKTQVFLTTGDSVVEMISNQPVTMKTEDPTGWVTGKDLETYLRYLYVLSADNRIYKYERLSNRYGPSVQYNVSGDLTGAMDMTIDGSVYVLKEKGVVVKLFRGEARPFAVRNLPENALKEATKVVKITDSNFYFLDPVRNRVVVVGDGGDAGDAPYAKQYVLEGDQMGKLVDLYVDAEESHLYVMDEKRLYVVDLVRR